eukprot:COSAG06_NODE_497_length_15020_cov_7.417733_13_plen_201_part_00
MSLQESRPVIREESHPAAADAYDRLFALAQQTRKPAPNPARRVETCPVPDLDLTTYDLIQFGTALCCCCCCCCRSGGSTRGGRPAHPQEQPHSARALSLQPSLRRHRSVGTAVYGEKTPFLRHLNIKCIILPRQARDKHRESTQKIMAFSDFFLVLPAGAGGGGKPVARSAAPGAMRKNRPLSIRSAPHPLSFPRLSFRC